MIVKLDAKKCSGDPVASVELHIPGISIYGSKNDTGYIKPCIGIVDELPAEPNKNDRYVVGLIVNEWDGETWKGTEIEDGQKFTTLVDFKEYQRNGDAIVLAKHGVSEHNELSERAVSDCHPIGAISGLRNALDLLGEALTTGDTNTLAAANNALATHNGNINTHADIRSAVNVLSQTLSLLYTNEQINNLLNNKVEKVDGKGLSANDYTNDEKTLVALLQGATSNIQAQLNALQGLGRNRGTVQTNALLSTISNPVEGDYAYVRADETHSGESWLYDYIVGTGWSASLRVNEVPRDFPTQPIQTNEIANQAVTTGKLANGAVTDTIIGNRTITNTATDAVTLTGTLTALLSSLSGRIVALFARFHATTGHKHNGADSPKISYNDLNDKPASSGIQAITNNGFPEVFSPDENGNCNIMTGTPPTLELTNPRLEMVQLFPDPESNPPVECLVFDISKPWTDLQNKTFSVKYNWDGVTPLPEPTQEDNKVAFKTSEGTYVLFASLAGTITVQDGAALYFASVSTYFSIINQGFEAPVALCQIPIVPVEILDYLDAQEPGSALDATQGRILNETKVQIGVQINTTPQPKTMQTLLQSEFDSLTFVKDVNTVYITLEG